MHRLMRWSAFRSNRHRNWSHGSALPRTSRGQVGSLVGRSYWECALELHLLVWGEATKGGNWLACLKPSLTMERELDGLLHTASSLIPWDCERAAWTPKQTSCLAGLLRSELHSRTTRSFDIALYTVLNEWLLQRVSLVMRLQASHQQWPMNTDGRGY
eukprot:1429789-Amphidinium_carterae.1